MSQVTKCFTIISVNIGEKMSTIKIVCESKVKVKRIGGEENHEILGNPDTKGSWRRATAAG